MNATRINFLWVEGPLGYIERLALQSAMDVGHKVVLWSYRPSTLGQVPKGVLVRDAADVMPRGRLITYADTGAVALGANFWRYELLAQGLGVWADLDLLFVKPLDLTSGYILGWEHEGWINNAIMQAPRSSAFVSDLQTIPKDNECPPWFGPRRTMVYHYRRWKEGALRIQDLPWGTYSAGLTTHIVKTRALQDVVSAPHVFYPVRWADARIVYEAAHHTEALLSEETCTVHLWHSRLVGLKEAPPAPGSYMDKALRRHGIDPHEPLSPGTDVGSRQASRASLVAA